MHGRKATQCHDRSVPPDDCPPLIRERVSEKAPQILYANKAIRGDVLDHETHFVHVRGHHDARSVALARKRRVDRPETIEGDVGSECVELLDDDHADRFLERGRPGRFGEPSHEVRGGIQLLSGNPLGRLCCYDGEQGDRQNEPVEAHVDLLMVGTRERVNMERPHVVRTVAYRIDAATSDRVSAHQT